MSFLETITSPQSALITTAVNLFEWVVGLITGKKAAAAPTANDTAQVAASAKESGVAQTELQYEEHANVEATAAAAARTAADTHVMLHDISASSTVDTNLGDPVNQDPDAHYRDAPGTPSA